MHNARQAVLSKLTARVQTARPPQPSYAHHICPLQRLGVARLPVEGELRLQVAPRLCGRAAKGERCLPEAPAHAPKRLSTANAAAAAVAVVKAVSSLRLRHHRRRRLRRAWSTHAAFVLKPMISTAIWSSSHSAANASRGFTIGACGHGTRKPGNQSLPSLGSALHGGGRTRSLRVPVVGPLLKMP